MISNEDVDRMNGQNQVQSSSYNQNRQVWNFSQSKTMSSNTQNTHGISLRPVSDLRQASFNALVMCTKGPL